MPTRDTDISRILNMRQLNFVYYWKGDAVEAARAAGYSDPRSAAYNLMQMDLICDLIRKKQVAIAEEAGKAIGKQLSFYRSDVINRLWELARMLPSQTGDTITGQIRAAEALANILSVGNHLEGDNRDLVKQLEGLRGQTGTPPTPQNEAGASPAPELAATQSAPEIPVASNGVQ